MKIRIVSVGNKVDTWLHNGIKNYEKKLPSFVKIEWIEIKPEKKFSSIKKKKKEEAIKIKNSIKESLYVCLDEHGNTFSSLGFSSKLGKWIQNLPSITFIIGGADGLDGDLLRGSLENISLSKMTLPHQSVKLILIEQLFRAFSILNNHPYHRD